MMPDSTPTPPSSGPDADAISKFYEGQLSGDEAALANLAKEEQASAPQFTEKPPERQQGITSVAPFLIGLAALGGKAAGLHATAMLGATNGMVQGLIQGNEQQYKDQKTAYDQAYEQYRTKWDAQNKIFNEMRAVYKGRADADLKALQFARQVTGDNAKVEQNAAKMHLQADEFDRKLRELTDSDAWKKAHAQAEEHLQERKLEMAKQKAAEDAGSPQNAALSAALIDKGVDIKGYRGKQLQMALTGLIARHPGESLDEIADGVKTGKLSMQEASTETTKLSQREAQIAPLEYSVVSPGGFLDQAKKAVDDLGLPNFKKKAEAEYYLMEQRVDPKLTAYKARIGELRAEYSQVLAKGGATSVHAQEESAKVVPEIITPAQFKEIEAAVKAGIQASKKGIRQSLDEVREPTPAAVASPPDAPPVKTTPPDAPPGTTHWGDLPD
jgi:hypothetical protein